VKFDGFVCFITVNRFELAEAMMWFDKFPIHVKISRSIDSVEALETGENVKVRFDGQDPSKSQAGICINN
jgi:hypothetical protein